MARTTIRKTKGAAQALTPAAKLRAFSRGARKAIENGIATTRAVAVVTGLEKVFEQRVSRTVARLGIPTSRDVRALSRQVAELQASVERLKRARARA